jgi:ABC-2 type transport system permease protein
MLLRPRSIILQVISAKIEFTRLGRMLQALIMFSYGISASHIAWEGKKIAVLTLMVIGGTVVFGCLFTIYASICFFTLEGLEFMNILTDGAREYGKYPVDIYGKRVLRLCTFLIPYALFQYYPFLYLTGRSGHEIYGLFPILGCMFVLPSYLLWKNGVRHFTSTGS